jgi:aconitate hydratase
MNTESTFTTGAGTDGKYYSLPALRDTGTAPNLDRLPVSIRIVLESLLRNCDGKKVTVEDVKNLAGWNAKSPGDYEIPFTVARIVLQDFTGVPLLVDVAAMRDAAVAQGADPSVVEPLVPVDLVVDHSVQVDFAGSQSALDRNMAIEFIRNRERYEFLKWGQQAFETFSVVPPGIGIVHQVNLEFLAKGVLSKDNVYYPDTLVGTDSHTTMINGLGVVGWGVGGIEAEAGMLGQPVTFLVPEVVGVYLHGALAEGVTATDLTLRVTEILRAHGVVGKFVEFYGPGAEALSLPDRATIANMAPEYGATMGFFPVDGETMKYLRGTGRSEELCQTVENYYKAQELYGIPQKGQIDYTDELELDLATIVPSVSGPKRPQDRIDVPALAERFNALFEAPVSEGGFGLPADKRSLRIPVNMPEPAGYAVGSLLEDPTPGDARDKAEMTNNRPTPDSVPAAIAFDPIDTQIGHGSILIAAITSCTNTSNPSVMLAAGLVAKKANEKGLKLAPYIKSSLGPGSRVVTDYLEATDLQKELDTLGFQTVGYGCTTCIGNAGPLHPAIEGAIKEGDLVCASVLSGNRNFEARIHGAIKANFLMSPPLVVAYALAGRVDIDLIADPLGMDQNGDPVFLADLWPTLAEVKDLLASALKPGVYQKLYGDFDSANPKWAEIPGKTGAAYEWDNASTYIQLPPFFDGYNGQLSDIVNITDARPLGIFGDSVTTDHISPAGAIKEDSPAGKYLLEHGVEKASFNSFGSRRGNDRVMTRGTFGNVRIKNRMVPGTEGGYTTYYGSHSDSSGITPLNNPKSTESGVSTHIYDAAMAYSAAGTAQIVIGGEDYGMGSSRDWAAKGTRLLGVSAVITKSFERIHRSNLIGMGVLPLNFKNAADYAAATAAHDATFSITGLSNDTKPRSEVTLTVKKADGSEETFPLIVRLDTPVEIDYYRAGGILPYVLAQILAQ